MWEVGEISVQIDQINVDTPWTEDRSVLIGWLDVSNSPQKDWSSRFDFNQACLKPYIH